MNELVERLKEKAKFFQREPIKFSPGDLVCQRKENLDSDGDQAYIYPALGTPALVLEVSDNNLCVMDRELGKPYKDSTMVIVNIVEGQALRYVVDPIYFELYEDR